ncbi:ADP-ribosylglycohydrolase family protein [Streptomyces rimosus]
MPPSGSGTHPPPPGGGTHPPPPTSRTNPPSPPPATAEARAPRTRRIASASDPTTTAGPAEAAIASAAAANGGTSPPHLAPHLARYRATGPQPANLPSSGLPPTTFPPPTPPPNRPTDPLRIEGLLLGLAAGDAAGWPAARHRAARMPEWTRRLTRELDTFAEQNATTTLPVPIALNQPPEPLRLGPSDDAEWAAFTAQAVLTAAGALPGGPDRDRRLRTALDLAWHALADEVAAAAERAPEVESAVLPLRARISVRAGLGNLAAGLRPPATGHDNPHFFDDAACVRACVLAVVHPGDPHAAAELAEFDARYTQDGDGVHGARAMAAAIAAALGGATADACADVALEQLPEGTEIRRNALHAVRLARTVATDHPHHRHRPDHPGHAFILVPTLEHEIVDHVYSYGIAAAETVPVALALGIAGGGRLAEAVPAAACLSRVADSAPALAGALTGALGGSAGVPRTWRDACRTLSGCALPRLAGTDLVELAARLARTETTTPDPAVPEPTAPESPARKD